MDFYNTYSSDDESASEEVVQSEVTPQTQIAARWLATTDDVDAEMEDEVLTKQERSTRSMQMLCDTFEQLLADSKWRDANKLFVTLLKNAATHKQKYNEQPEPFIVCLDNCSDFPDRAKAEIEKEQSGKEHKSLKLLTVQLEKALEDFSKNIARLDMEDEEAEEDETAGGTSQAAAAKRQESREQKDGEEKELDFNDYVEMALKVSESREKKAAKLRSIAAACGAKGFTAVQLFALGMGADALLHDDTHLTVTMVKWRSAFTLVERCFALACANPNISLDDGAAAITPTRVVLPGGLHQRLQNLYSYLIPITRFNDGAYKLSFLSLPQYENDLADLTAAVLAQFRSTKNRQTLLVCSRILLNLLSPRSQAAHDILYPLMTRHTQAATASVVTASVIDTVNELYAILAPLSSGDAKMHAVCCVVYQLGLCGRYREGLDTVRRSGLYEYIQFQEDEERSAAANAALSILYNRAIAQLGLAAFYAGDIDETYNLVGSLWSFDQSELLIGQAMPHQWYTLRPEEQLRYRDLLVPLHIRIPSQCLALAAMLAALIVDTAREARTPYERSRHQRYFFQVITRRHQLFGKPALLADQVEVAYDALKAGNYRQVREIVESMAEWEYIPNKEAVLEKYLGHLKQTALRIFCYINRCNFSTLSMSQLALKYDLSKAQVRDTINEIIAENSTLIAYWDRDDEFLYVDRNNSTRLQHLIVKTADIVTSLVPFTERRGREGEGRGRYYDGRGRGGRGGGGRGRGMARGRQ